MDECVFLFVLNVRDGDQRFEVSEVWYGGRDNPEFI